jgi:predicted TIM-barrel fold metal-dependent hydrolase
MTTTDENLVYLSDRKLPYAVFDADNHMYENRDALTKFLPREYEGLVKYVEVNGRTKLAIADRITNYIPNPTFNRVAVPGIYGLDVSKSARGDRAAAGDIPRGERVRAMPGLDAFFDPEPRFELMKDMGIDRSLLWPTLASSLEERLAYDPDAACVAIHALNEWMHEHWTFNYGDALFATPIITLAKLDSALAELERISERGAKIFLIRVAPVPTWRGTRSFALPEFDPFWERVQELGILVGMHAGDPGYTKYVNEWEGVEREANFGSIGNPAFVSLMSEKNALIDAMASIIGHGLASRFPDLKFLPVEHNSGWIRPFVAKLQRTFERSPGMFDEDPFETFKRSIYIHVFHEANPKGLLDIGLAADHLMFGSDFPHPEGMADPLAYSEVVEGLALEDQQLIMGGTLSRLMGFERAAV